MTYSTVSSLLKGGKLLLRHLQQTGRQPLLTIQ